VLGQKRGKSLETDNFARERLKIVFAVINTSSNAGGSGILVGEGAWGLEEEEMGGTGMVGRGKVGRRLGEEGRAGVCCANEVK
jgi:hypothetical protein